MLTTPDIIPAATQSIYARKQNRDLDIGQLMRDGHPFIAAGDRYIVDLVTRWCRGRSSPAILEVGSGSGVLCRKLAIALPQAEIIANETEPALVAFASRRLELTRTKVFSESFLNWSDPLNVVISWGSHHHLTNDYLEHISKVLVAGGLFVLGDEFCPEYCLREDKDRLAKAERILIQDGFVLTSVTEHRRYEESSELPLFALALEKKRQKALWHWYKYVIDFALKRQCPEVAIAELEIAANDLRTDYLGEHKLSPAIVERDLETRGFKVLSKRCIGPRDPALASFFVYTIEAPVR